MHLEGKSLRSDFLKFTTATITSLLVFSLYSMVDGLFVAWGVEEYAMSAVNLAVPFTNALFSIAVLFAVGTSTLIAIFLGQQRQAEANRLFSQNLMVLTVIGLAITALVFLFLEPFSLFLGATDVTLSYVKDYLSGLAPFSVFFILSYNLEVLVKTDGRPRLALLCVVTGCLFNCLGDYLTIFIFGMGTFGAALATGLSQLLTTLIYLGHFLGKRTSFHPVRFRFDGAIYRRLLPIGLSDGVTELCNGVMIFLFNRTILRYIGADGLVSYTIIAYVNLLVVNVMVGISQGAQPLVSYHHGKAEPDKCRRLLRYGMVSVAAVAAVGFALLYLLAPQLVQAYLGTKNPALNEYSVRAFRQYSFAYLPVGFNILAGGFLTAVERPKPAIAISMGRGLVVQGACLLALAALWGGGALWSATALSECLCLLPSVIFLWQYGKSTSKKSLLV